MSFGAKIDLALALDARPSEFEGALRRVNKVRNTAAHGLEFARTAETMDSLISSLTPITRIGRERTHAPTDDPPSHQGKVATLQTE